ncbi:3-deoxy-D-manno-octulosonic acid transferase [Sabulilitoribacter arenilitoris]|uniref:3-deoxy-D-manno-octulosonic acid transferase n=1 Tax=Wocania arenilitoris TaxID=2044858 RepID=A0AAE3ELF5_9FLAO|nr:glycosyltransferase N-terminal domain-containing protein [Wocania arenilitoris]MCF7567086.1 3-deoxy-D-manno-octulosonic acid transferase [Wocania arenilitoris]
MSLIYNLLISIVDFGLKCVAPFNKKLNLGVKGRSKTFTILKNTLNKHDKTLWFHCASLGEYEQGLPVFQALRTHYKSHKIVLTFFSPSGYQIRKNSPIADVVVYLPLDTKKNAKTFISLVKPELTIFVKYDIWPNFLNELKQNNLRAILISAAFRKNQSFFKFYGKTLQSALFSFEHIFTQNTTTKTLLQSINYNNVTVSGDTRFDRVYSQLNENNQLNFIESFKGKSLCVVAGSTWLPDENLFINYINNNTTNHVKFIIAPHNIKPSQINNLKQRLNTHVVLYSEMANQNLTEANVFIIDTIGLLSKIYNYADIAYVGGAMGTTGLHNTLEPATFGVPIIIGSNHSKFNEAKSMIDIKGMFSISNQKEFDDILNKLISNSDFRDKSGSNNLEFIKENRGAVIQILNYIRI